MIRIFIADTGEALDLPKDLKLSIELTSPLFSEQGSVSLPVTLPATMRNKSLLQYVTMPQVMQSKATSFDVVVTLINRYGEEKEMHFKKKESQ